MACWQCLVQRICRVHSLLNIAVDQVRWGGSEGCRAALLVQVNSLVWLLIDESPAGIIVMGLFIVTDF